MGLDMLVLAILGGWLVLSVVVCLALCVGIRHADTREAVDLPKLGRTPDRRPARPLSVA